MKLPRKDKSSLFVIVRINHKSFSASTLPPDQGSTPAPSRGLCPNTSVYSMAFCTRHVAPADVNPPLSAKIEQE